MKTPRAVKLPSSPFVSITRILGVRDTRDRIEVGDRWVAVPGTGDLRPCDRCCREHEIHVEVELSDGRRANIGSGCAKGESMEIQARLKSAVSAAKTRSKLRGELALVHDEHTRAEQAWKEVEELRPPPPELQEEIHEAHGTRQIWGMEDARVWTVPGSARGFDAERRQALLSSWRGNRYRERGFEMPPYSYKRRSEDLAERISKIESKLGSLLF